MLEIKGNFSPKVGDVELYTVKEPDRFSILSFVMPTEISPYDQDIKWSLSIKENGHWRVAKGNEKLGETVSFTLGEKVLTREAVKITVQKGSFEYSEALITPKPAVAPKLLAVEILNKDGAIPTEPFYYGQTVVARVHGVGLNYGLINVTLWEEGTPHAERNTKTQQVEIKNGKGEASFMLPTNFIKMAEAQNAQGGSSNGKTHESYISAAIADRYIPAQYVDTHVKKDDEGAITATIPIDAREIKFDKPDETNKVLTVQITENIEDIITAYFAKEEYTIKNDEKVGRQYYRFKNDQKRGFDKERTAAIIMEKVTAEIKADKRYVKVEDIKNALVERSYKKDDPISFNLYKLGANYIRLNSAPLEEEVFVVAHTYLLDGKEVTITIKEKEAILVAADADVMVVEAKENGAEITTLKATVENGIAKVKVKLRPKSDEDLKTWKEKLANGIKDGTHKYIVKSTFTVAGDLDKIASSIEKKSNEALAQKNTVKKADISTLLAEGATYPAGTLLDVPKYKKAEEMLWLKAECQGDIKKHKGEFLKRDGEYLVIGQDKCVCKEYDLIWGDKVSCDFRKKVVEICSDLWGESKKIEMANGLMAVMNVETGGSFKAHQIMGRSLQDKNTIVKDDFFKNNRTSSRAVGLIQFTQDALVQIGEFTDGTGFDKLHEVKLKLAKMGEVKQLYYVKKYFEESKNKIKTPEDIYLQVFAPSGVGKRDDFVLYDGGEKYRQNESVDTENNSDGKIQRSEILGRYRISFAQGLGNKVKKSFCVLNQENEGNSNWHDPVDDPMLCLYTQNGNYRPRYNVFGNVRTERSNIKHQGIDFLALPDSNAYACVDAYIEFIQVQSGYGNVVCLKVKDTQKFLERKRDFELVYEAEGEILQGDSFNFDGDIYLFYAHLKEVLITEDEKEVTCGKIIGLNGTSGYGSSKDPHLHFEIRNSSTATGLNNRCHPGYFVYYKNETDMTQIEKDYHKEIAEKYWD